MRTTLAILAVSVATACSPIHESSYQLEYSVIPRAMLWRAIEAARELHYSIAAVESDDVFHNAFLAFAEGSPQRAPSALLVHIDSADLAPVSPDVGHASWGRGTAVNVIPMRFRDGKAVPVKEVSPGTRADAEQLMIAIYDRSRGDRQLP